MSAMDSLKRRTAETKKHLEKARDTLEGIYGELNRIYELYDDSPEAESYDGNTGHKMLLDDLSRVRGALELSQILSGALISAQDSMQHQYGLRQEITEDEKIAEYEAERLRSLGYKEDDGSLTVAQRNRGTLWVK